MADNFVTNPAAGGDTFAADDIAGVKWQRVKIGHGADGSATDVSSASPLPVDTELPSGLSTASHARAPGNSLAVSNEIWNGSSLDIQAATTQDAQSPTGIAAAGGVLWNGSSFDRQRGNTDPAAVLASAARTAGVNSPDQYNYNHRGARVTLTCTAKAAATTLTVTYYTYDAVTGYSMVGVPFAAWAAGVGASMAFDIYPGIQIQQQSYLQSQSYMLPRRWNLNVAHSDANSITYAAQVTYIV